MRQLLEELVSNGAKIDIDYYLNKIKQYNDKNQLTKEIDDYIKEFDQNNNYDLKNISIALTNPYNEYYYNYQANVIYDIASITKLFTLKGIYDLYKQNKIDINKNVIDYMPNFVNFKDYTILDTIKMLGIIETKGKLSDTKTSMEFDNLLTTVEVKSKDEKDTGYTDIGHIILGELIEKVSGESLAKYFKETIFDKYNMPNTMYNPTRNYKLYGNGNKLYLPHDFKTRTANGTTGAAGLFSNVKDLTNFAKALYNYELFDKEFIEQIYNYNFIDSKNRVRSYSGIYKYTEEYPCYIPKQFTKYALSHQGFTSALVVSDIKFKMTQVMLFDAIKDGSKVKHPDFLKGFYEFQAKISEYSILLYIINKKEHI